MGRAYITENREQIAKALLDNSEGYFKCPLCGESADAGYRLRPISGTDRYLCDACHQPMDILDIVGVKFGLEREDDRIQKAEEILHEKRAEKAETVTSLTPQQIEQTNDDIIKAIGSVTGYYPPFVLEADGGNAVQEDAGSGTPADAGNQQATALMSASLSMRGLREQIVANLERPFLSTGFSELDRSLGGGIRSGLYVIGQSHHSAKQRSCSR